MKENGENFTGEKERDDAMMDFVFRQAQEAILDPHLPENYKDEVVGAAVGTLHQIAERKKSYEGKAPESSEPKSQIIYEASTVGTRRPRHMPDIIREINSLLREGLSESEPAPTCEDIAKSLGIGKRKLYGWVKNNEEFSKSLEMLRTVQKEDPFRTGTPEDSQVNAAALTLLLLETQLQVNKDTQRG